MLVPVLLAAVAVALLVAKIAPRVSVVTQALLVVVAGYVFGYEVWHADAGPIPLTLDRIALAGLVGLSLWRIAKGETPRVRPIGLDWLIGLTFGWLTLSCVMNRPPDGIELPTSPMFRLLFSFWAPAALFAVLRTSKIDQAAARRWMTGLALLGVYLGVTAILETLQVWSLVFPRYIANPELGLHYGRARGPMLNSVSLGVHLSVGAVAAWLLASRSSRLARVAWLAAWALMCVGVGLTFTRSTWLGLAGAGVTVVCLQAPRVWRLPAFATAGVMAVLLLVVGKDAIVGLEREDSAATSAHSVQQRTAFAYVSAQMFQDHPVAGVGFGRFYDQKLPYLTDRRQSFELESLRPLHHHNTLLSLLVETGLPGLVGFLAILSGFAWVGWQLAYAEHAGPDANALGLLQIGAVVNYLPSALFHDLSLVHTEQWLLFAIAGAGTGCWLSRSRVPAATTAASPVPPAAAPARAAKKPLSIPRPAFLRNAKQRPMTKDSIRLFGLTIDRLRLEGAVERLLGWSLVDKQDGPCRFVVTPNVDHAVMYQHDYRLRAAYADASMVVADGAPLIAVSRLLGRPLPERVAGSDLAPGLISAADQVAAKGGRRLRVFLLGAGPGVADRAAFRIGLRWPNVDVCGTCCPPLGFEKDDAENEKILATLAEAKPDVVLVGLGAPKQELWVHRFQDRIPARVALCVGATIDFLAGEKDRAPVWMQRCGLEWAHRLASEPRRLAARYARDAWIFPQLVWDEYRGAFR